MGGTSIRVAISRGHGRHTCKILWAGCGQEASELIVHILLTSEAVGIPSHQSVLMLGCDSALLIDIMGWVWPPLGMTFDLSPHPPLH